MAPAAQGEAVTMDHETWMAAAAVEYERLVGLLGGLDAEDWSRPTDCTEWDVRAMVAHLVGAAEGNARIREAVRQAVVGRRRFRRDVLVDSINMVQIEDRAGRTPAQSWWIWRTPGAAGWRRGRASLARSAAWSCRSDRPWAPSPSAT